MQLHAASQMQFRKIARPSGDLIAGRISSKLVILLLDSNPNVVSAISGSPDLNMLQKMTNPEGCGSTGTS
jgi:hypothetical protein